MGACATKPKVLKDDAQAPVTAPDPAVEEAVAVHQINREERSVPVVQEVKDKKVVENEGGDKVIKEIVDDDKADDQSTKRRSLSHLFQEVFN